MIEGSRHDKRKAVAPRKLQGEGLGGNLGVGVRVQGIEGRRFPQGEIHGARVPIDLGGTGDENGWMQSNRAETFQERDRATHVDAKRLRWIARCIRGVRHSGEVCDGVDRPDPTEDGLQSVPIGDVERMVPGQLDEVAPAREPHNVPTVSRRFVAWGILAESRTSGR